VKFVHETLIFAKFARWRKNVASHSRLALKKGLKRLRSAPKEFWLLSISLFLLVLSLYFFLVNCQLRREISLLQQKVVSLELRGKELETKVDQLQKEKEDLLLNAVGSLRQRTTYMEKLISQLGLSRQLRRSKNKVKHKAKAPVGVGGPYLPPQKEYEVLLERIEEYLSMVQQVPIGKPCRGYISSSYGYRRDPFTGRRAFHAGIDIVSRYGAPVRATADGVVYKVGYNRSLGRFVKIKHKHGFMTIYGHLRKYVVKRGERVKRGDIIGYLGTTGRSTGPHLHYEIRRWGKSLNPIRFIRAERKLAKIAP